MNFSKNILKTVLCAIIMASAFSSQADAALNPGSSYAGSLGFGTTGVNAGIFYKEYSGLVANVNIGGLNVDPIFSAGGENYKMNIRLASARIVEDWYPFKNNLFLSAGILINNDRLNLTPTGGQGQYALATPATLRVSPVAPYIGVGYGYPFTGSRWTLEAEAGAAYEAHDQISVTMGSGPYAAQAYNAEKSSITSALSGLHWYPVIQTELVYRF